MTVASIAQRQQIPRKSLALILSRLKIGGLVEARRGVDGGYRLARPPEEITVGEVLKLTERRKPATGSGSEVLAELWGQVDTAVAAIIDETTFADLIGRCSDIQTPYVPN